MPEPDPDRLRAVIEHLETIERGSASAGEHEAAAWIRDRLEALGARDARIELERAHGTYWWPLGLATAAAFLAGARAPRPVAFATGALAAAVIADDVSAGRHWHRRLLPARRTANVVAEAGDPDGTRTVVFVAHHDAAHGGLIFDPSLLIWLQKTFPDWYETNETSPQLMWLTMSGPLLVALGALTGSRRLRRIGTISSFNTTASLVDIGVRRVVPGANDNLTAVAVVCELARLLSEDPVPGVRVLLVSTGSEESFMEGMRGWCARHLPDLDPASTEIVVLESLGAPFMTIVEAEGMLRMRDYPAASKDRLAAAAERAGVPVRRGLRLGFATDGLISLKAGFPSAVLASVTKYKFTSNYHSPNDIAANVDFGTVTSAVRVCRELIRGLSPARGPAPAPARAS